MCGLTGFYIFENKKADDIKESLTNAVKSLESRGPDANNIIIENNVGLGHTRLAVIDTDSSANQPFTDESKRYMIVFNGEFYNYKEYKKELQDDGVLFKTKSDTEVLLYLLIKYEERAIPKINGCFSFVFYNKEKNKLILARDRMGINPMLYYYDKNVLYFASETKALVEYDFKKEIDMEAAFSYFQLNYIPSKQSIYKNVVKLEPGTSLTIENNSIKTEKYYSIPFNSASKTCDYEKAKKRLYELLSEAVKTRLEADVPSGCFLSGGIDSSIITALASEHTKSLKTFSLSFKGDKHFDEAKYAEMLAKKFNTDHTTINISEEDVLDKIYDALDYIDEPFADSSAIAVYSLCYHTSKHVTVALSGDGADEMFAGYNKHRAHFNTIYPGSKEKIVSSLKPLWSLMPKSRNNEYSNFFRQLMRFSEGANLKPSEKYWFWASIGTEEYAKKLIKDNIDVEAFYNIKNYYLDKDKDFNKINDILHTDMKLVLQGDMLTKVDLMSMANSLEVRTPFLDHNVVNFVFSLPEYYKIDSYSNKKILKDCFKDILPKELLLRKKHGFEVPLLKWLKNELWNDINEKYLSEKFINQQNIFDYKTVKKLKKQLLSDNPSDSHAKIWALFVFQYWWNKNFL